MNPEPRLSHSGDLRSRGRLRQLIEQRQAHGKLVGTLEELAQKGQVSELAVRRQLARLAPAVVRLPGRPSIYLTIPTEDRPRGAPPIASWLHDYLSERVPHYYVGLLSAAALHGSSSQVPLATQVMVPVPLRAFEVGRLRIEFTVKRSLAATPLADLAGLAAPLNVSGPAATLLDLVAFSSRVGGMVRVAEVASGLRPKLNARDLRRALEADIAQPVVQRTGYLLEVLGVESLAKIAESFLSRPDTVPLQAGKIAVNAATNHRWHILENMALAGNHPG
jgi:predicted transcriptional regulator of viral defense system